MTENKFVAEVLGGKTPFEADGVQTFLRELGEKGCYCLCILRLAMKFAGGITSGACLLSIAEGVRRKWIRYGGAGDADNFYMECPDAFLSFLTDKRWTVRKEGAGYKCREGELEVLQYRNGGATHFRLADFDPLENSVTVAKGELAGKRIFSLV